MKLILVDGNGKWVNDGTHELSNLTILAFLQLKNRKIRSTKPPYAYTGYGFVVFPYSCFGASGPIIFSKIKKTGD
jgi:hypothetical protein